MRRGKENKNGTQEKNKNGEADFRNAKGETVRILRNTIVVFHLIPSVESLPP